MRLSTTDFTKPGDEIIENSRKSLDSMRGDIAYREKLIQRILLKLDTRYRREDEPIHGWLTIDYRILPILALLFLFSFLDRTNVGNAKILGLEEDVKINDHQYDIGLAVYYLTYVCR